MAAETVNASIAVLIHPLRELSQPPGFAKVGVLHLIQGEQSEPQRLHPLSAKPLDGEFGDRFFRSSGSVGRATLYSGRVADHFTFLANRVEGHKRHDPA